jgi:hypothetical protein
MRASLICLVCVPLLLAAGCDPKIDASGAASQPAPKIGNGLIISIQVPKCPLQIGGPTMKPFNPQPGQSLSNMDLRAGQGIAGPRVNPPTQAPGGK